MKKIALIMSFLLLLGATVANAQTKMVSGTVTSSEDGMPIPGVSVSVAGTTMGTVTDIDGVFTLKVPQDAKALLASFVGMKTQTVELGEGSDYAIVMEPDLVGIDEVVVTALGISREKKSLGYSAQQLTGDDIAAVKDANVVNSLSGKVAGVQVTGSTGTVGGSSRIVIRGVNSISGNNQPLFIVDGTPIDNSNFNSTGTQNGGGGTDWGNSAADINPEDIESMTVLKGANAAALYGSRAANGVILITTKKGTKRKGIGVSISTGVNVTTVALLPDYQNEYGGGYKQSFDTYEGEPVVNYAADESWGPKMDGTLVRQWYSWYEDDEDYGQMTPFVAHPNNVKDFYETGITTNNNVAIEGGGEGTLFRLSYTNFKQTGTLPTSELKRNTIAFSGSSKLTDKLTASASMNYVKTKNDGIPSQGYSGVQGNVVTSFNQWFQRQIDMDKLANYKTADGVDRTWNISSPTNLHPLYWENPYWVINESPANLQRDRVFGNVSLKYDVLPGLTVQGWARTDFYNDRREQRIASGSIPQAWYQEQVRQMEDNNFEFLATYTKNITSDFSLDANFGANKRVRNYYNNTASTNGGLSVPNFFNVTASVDRPSITDYKDKKVVNSLYGSASFGYKSMAYVDVSLRNDWSSTLPEGNNSYLYPAVTGTFLFSELIEDKSILSLGKVRASWSQVGNDTDPYQLAVTYSSGNNYGSYPAYSVPNNLKNADLKPETIETVEFGAEFGFFENRLGLDVTYYDIKSKDQILGLSTASTSGYSSAVVNAGLITNKGWEVMLRARPIDKEFTWDVVVNWAKNNNKVVELAEGVDNYVLASWGPSINAKEGETYGTWVTDGFTYNEDGERLVDEDGYYVRSTNQTYGSYLPDWTGGVTNSFSYKGISVSALVDFQKGGQLYSVTNRYGEYSGLLASTVGNNAKGNPMRDPVSEGGGMLAEGVKEDGTPNDVYIEAVDYWKAMRNYRENYLYDASFIKLREVKIGYSLPSSLFANTFINGVNVALVGRNLAILHKNIPNVDAESAYGSGNIQGFENGQHPSTRTMGFSVNVKF
ncbi:SusC/RagA family TonB-linked outer membrane protein [Draconibacterium sp. IB214405]|uniref:SusC/RagA family TonB-linked outer membrane protein n=1 Tax=Draconibacterium sp. IB214405 TaxID=3097352 RepID=UPI002A17DF9C|nr:SusC/RagA family TonB-linked outer membrane protein [Draconibacterium sp. IB214405]MDX8340836.1 SusC/RagA family TonB-linked outer membrane protein [Draconibacterium sp. IB214405]